MMTDKRSVLVTGGAGYVGSHVVHALRDAEMGVVVIDDMSTGFENAVPADVEIFLGDLADADLVREVARRYHVDVVAHFGAKTVVPDSVTDPLGYYEANTCKSRALLAATAAAGVRSFVFSSTAAVYGDAGPEPVDEDAPTSPINPYGRSKLMVETMLRDVEEARGLRHVILRYFNVAGADPMGRVGQSTRAATHLVKVAVQAALGLRDGIDVYGTDHETRDGTCVRDFIQVNDLADAHVAAIAHLRSGGRSVTCNCGYGVGVSVLEVIDAVKRVSGVDFPVRVAPRRAGDPASVVAKPQRITSDIGWIPRHYGIDAIVRQALSWERRLSKVGPEEVAGVGTRAKLPA